MSLKAISLYLLSLTSCIRCLFCATTFPKCFSLFRWESDGIFSDGVVVNALCIHQRWQGNNLISIDSCPIICAIAQHISFSSAEEDTSRYQEENCTRLARLCSFHPSLIVFLLGDEIGFFFFFFFVSIPLCTFWIMVAVSPILSDSLIEAGMTIFSSHPSIHRPTLPCAQDNSH